LILAMKVLKDILTHGALRNRGQNVLIVKNIIVNVPLCMTERNRYAKVYL